MYRAISAVGRRLEPLEEWVVASPSYLARRPALESLDQLASHPCVLYQGAHGRKTWRVSGPDGEREVEVSGPIDADDLAFVHSAVVAGAGVGLLPSVLAYPGVRRGTLVRLLPNHAGKGAAMFILWPSSAHLPAGVALLRDFLVDNLVSRCQKHCEGDAGDMALGDRTTSVAG